MILQALYDCYEKLLADPESGIAPPHYSNEPVSHAFELATDGKLLAVYPLYEMQGRKRINRRMSLPERVKGRRGVAANFMSDNSSYVLGYDNKGKPERSRKCFEAFVELHNNILGQVNDAGAQALLAFLNGRQAGDVSDSALGKYQEELLEGGNIVFMLATEPGYLHERPAIRQAWEQYCVNMQSQTLAQCLITGEYQPIARLHPSIKGVEGAHSSGASIVSFNDQAYESYGKVKSYNAPVSEKAASAYTSALNYLLANKKYNTLIGDASSVFWAEGQAKREEELLASFWGIEPTADAGINEEVTGLLRDTLERIRRGQDIRDLDLDPNVRIHILGLAPNAGRVSIRFYQTELFGTLLERFNLHFTDMQITQPEQYRNDFPPVWRLLAETAVQGKRENIPNTLITNTMCAILKGTPYPRSLYQAILMRIRADKQINSLRAGMIKAFLIRQARATRKEEGEYTVALSEDNKQPAYLLGRLFAQLERAQLNAQGESLNKTIRDTYFSAASATPAVVFPRLLRLAQHHISKEKEKNRWVDRDIGRILADLELAGAGAAFPASLSLQDQGLFILGYYHQRQDFYIPRKDRIEKEEE